jgi:HSP90 family molecular chaperone
MSIDKSKLPAPVRAMMEALEAKGVKVHLAEIKIDGIELATAEHMGGEKFTLLNDEPPPSAATGTNSQTSSPASTDEDEDDDGPQQFVETLVEIMKEGLQSLHNHLCPRIKTLEREARDARRDIDELKARIAVKN